MKETLFNYINIDLKNTFIPDGMTANPEKHCKEYDKLIEERGHRHSNTWHWRKWSYCI